MIILQIWTELTCGKTLNSHLWKKKPEYENQTIPAQRNIIDKILSEKSANDISVGCRYSLFRKEKTACWHEEDTELMFLCVCMGEKGCRVGRREAVNLTGMGCDSATPASIHCVW